MKKLFILVLLCLFTLGLSAQFENKVSFNFSAGSFKTFGKKMGLYDPMQMPSYKAGPGASASVQLNINRHFSLVFDISALYSPGWLYKIGDFNYLHYTIIVDTVTNEVLAENENKLNLLNIGIAIEPKYYLFAVRKWNPYLFTGISLNFTRAKFTDNGWKDMVRLGLNQPGDTEFDPFLEKNTGIGISPGIGLEFSPTDKLNFFAESAYLFIKMKLENFKNENLVENLNAVTLRAGVRLSFLKSKNL